MPIVRKPTTLTAIKLLISHECPVSIARTTAQQYLVVTGYVLEWLCGYFQINQDKRTWSL